MRRERIFLISFLVFAIQPVSLMTGEPRVVRDLVEEALRNNPELRFFEAQIEVAKGNRIQGGLWRNPELSSLGGPITVLDGKGREIGSGYWQQHQLLQPFEFPGKATLRKAILDRDMDLAQLGLEQFRLSLANRVRFLAYRLAILRSNSTTASEIVQRSRMLVSLLKKRRLAGIVALLDLRIIEGNLVDLGRTMRELEQERRSVASELQGLLGRSYDEPVLEAGLPVPNWFPSLGLSELLQTAFLNSLPLRMRQIEIGKAAKLVDYQKLGAFPDFSLGPFLYEENSQVSARGEARRSGVEDFFYPGVSVTLPLPIWNRNTGNIVAAQAAQKQAEALYRTYQKQLQAAVLSRYAVYERARKELASYPEGLLEELHRAADLADRQYRLGTVPVQTFLEMQRQYMAAAMALRAARLDAEAALLDLHTLTGGKLPSGF
ncbi:Heavy metal RND efflux outer membrane protein, CzcC family [Candidatus Methylacidithermus pantelleriae]|uniref:Heavy metal RND efflux outer membrane protein, CzcC family n=2 Tax=Candidatus Methylacidithermus pantelleriae TaxID=2744239 RepID=A0A8J2BQU7_9BACT|nr:Heavy metal RND efflux outer membrane protein, CzcC family [Candidatus Methylacidithermus pantelleriae]